MSDAVPPLVYRGATFYGRFSRREPEKHLHIVITAPYAPAGEPPQVLLVNITSIKPALRYDPACVLREGDHPYIRWDSYVYYTECQLVEVRTLHRLIQTGKFTKRPNMPAPVLKRIGDGLARSDFLRDADRKQRFYALAGANQAP